MKFGFTMEENTIHLEWMDSFKSMDLRQAFKFYMEKRREHNLQKKINIEFSFYDWGDKKFRIQDNLNQGKVKEAQHLCG